MTDHKRCTLVAVVVVDTVVAVGTVVVVDSVVVAVVVVEVVAAVVLVEESLSAVDGVVAVETETGFLVVPENSCYYCYHYVHLVLTLRF